MRDGPGATVTGGTTGIGQAITERYPDEDVDTLPGVHFQDTDAERIVD